MRDSTISDFIRALLSFFIPPIGVLLQVGLKTPFWINLILTFLGYVPGMIHAMYCIIHYNVGDLDMQ